MTAINSIAPIEKGGRDHLTPEGRRIASLNAIKHGTRRLDVGLWPVCRKCIFKDECPEFRIDKPVCTIFPRLQEARIQRIMDLDWIHEADRDTVIRYAKNITWLEVCDLWVSRVGPFVLKNGLDQQPVLRSRWTTDGAADRQAKALGLTPESRKALNIDPTKVIGPSLEEIKARYTLPVTERDEDARRHEEGE